MGIRRVYDLEIEEDHCYIANDIYVHNSDPNLTNLPAGSKYGKLIKKCFKGNKNNLFVGTDFSSLEDYINALLTKDPNKLKIYLGHEIYELTINGICHHIRDDAIISYDGITYTGKEFYAFYTSS